MILAIHSLFSNIHSRHFCALLCTRLNLYLTSLSTPPAILSDFQTSVWNREKECKRMNLNDVVTLCVAIATLILRVWEARRNRRGGSDETDQLED